MARVVKGVHHRVLRLVHELLSVCVVGWASRSRAGNDTMLPVATQRKVSTSRHSSTRCSLLLTHRLYDVILNGTVIGTTKPFTVGTKWSLLVALIDANVHV